jgi:Uri superfamily endonuclease
MKGSYILVIELKRDKTIQVGKLGKIFFKKGFYVYVGSALNGLEQRIRRHLRSNKKRYWHIDYLLQYATITNVFYKESKDKEECKIAGILAKKLKSIQSFGSSDCKCKSHLFYRSKKGLENIIKQLKMIFYEINANT